MRILCLADVHLGCGADYGAKPGDRLADQERVLDQVASLIVSENVDHLLLAGDCFHRPKPTPAELLVFQRFLDKIDVQTTIIPGNHDYASASDPVILELFESFSVQYLASPAVTSFPTWSLAVLPWSPPSRVYAQSDEDRVDASRSVADLLVEVAAGLRAQITDGPAVLCTHWSVSGAVSSTGALADDFREPVLSATALEAQGWDAIVCGHLHKFQGLGSCNLAEGWRPFFYTGSPGVCDFGEADHEHGVVILDVDADGAAFSFVPLDDRPFVTIDRLEDVVTPSDDLLASLPGAVVRVRYDASPAALDYVDPDDIRRWLIDRGVHRVYQVQRNIIRADRARSSTVTDESGPGEAVDAYIASRSLDDATGEQLRDRTHAYLERAR